MKVRAALGEEAHWYREHRAMVQCLRDHGWEFRVPAYPSEITGSWRHPRIDGRIFLSWPDEPPSWAHVATGGKVSGYSAERLRSYLGIAKASRGDLRRLRRADEGLFRGDAIHEKRPQEPVFRRALRLRRPRPRRRFTWYSEDLKKVCAWCRKDLGSVPDPQTGTSHGICPECSEKVLRDYRQSRKVESLHEDTFIRAQVNPSLDIPKHHELLTRYGFKYLDAVPLKLENNQEFIHSYIHEKDGHITVCSDGAWSLHTQHGQEHWHPPGPGTWLPLHTVLRENYRITEATHTVSVGDTVTLRDRPLPTGALKTGGGAVMQHYFYRPEYYQGQHPLEDPELFQEGPPREPPEVEKTIDQVLAGLSTREAVNHLVREMT